MNSCGRLSKTRPCLRSSEDFFFSRFFRQHVFYPEPLLTSFRSFSIMVLSCSVKLFSKYYIDAPSTYDLIHRLSCLFQQHASLQSNHSKPISTLPAKRFNKRTIITQQTLSPFDARRPFDACRPFSAQQKLYSQSRRASRIASQKNT